MAGVHGPVGGARRGWPELRRNCRLPEERSRSRSMKDPKNVSWVGIKPPKGVGRSSKKKWQREQLVIAMLQQPTWQKAAAATGVSEVTAWGIRQTPELQREYLQARREALCQCLARLQQGSSAAVATLLKILVDPNSPVSSR